MYLSFSHPNVQFVWRKIDAIGGDTVHPVSTNVADPFLMEFVPKSSTLTPRHSNSDL